MTVELSSYGGNAEKVVKIGKKLIMKKLSLATAGAVFMVLGAVGTLAAAEKIEFDYTAEVSSNVFINPIFATQIEQNLGLNPGELPQGNFAINEVFNGTFTNPDDPQQYLDGDIELDLSLLSSISGLNFLGLSPLLEQSNVLLSGNGNLTSSLGILPFNLGFNAQNKSIKITFDPNQANIIDGCFVGACTAKATGVNASVALKANNALVASVTNLNFSATTTPNTVRLSSKPGRLRFVTQVY
jgi:hypothetical protein